MKKIFALLLCLVLVFSVTATFVAVEGGEEQYPQESFSVVEKNLITGEETIETTVNANLEEILDEYSSHNQQPNFRSEIIAPYQIIGNNDMELIEDTTEWPYSAVAFIKVYWPNAETTRGTASLISSNVAVTAAHNLYNAELDMWATSVTVYPGMSDSDLIGSLLNGYQSSVLAASIDWVERGDINYDWGTIVLDEEVDESDIGFYFVIDFFPTNPPTNMPITVLGYPNTGSLVTNYSQHMSNGVITDVSPNIFLHNADTLEGSSGSPILSQRADIIGINVGRSSPENGNIGVKMDTNAIVNIFNIVSRYRP